MLVPTLILVSTGANAGASCSNPSEHPPLSTMSVLPRASTRPTLELRASRLLLGEMQQGHPGEPHAEQDDRAVILRESPKWRVHRCAVLSAD